MPRDARSDLERRAVCQPRFGRPSDGASGCRLPSGAQLPADHEQSAAAHRNRRRPSAAAHARPIRRSGTGLGRTLRGSVRRYACQHTRQQGPHVRGLERLTHRARQAHHRRKVGAARPLYHDTKLASPSSRLQPPYISLYLPAASPEGARARSTARSTRRATCAARWSTARARTPTTTRTRCRMTAQVCSRCGAAAAASSSG